MQKLFAGIQILGKPQEFLSVNVDFEENVENLKQIIAEKIDFKADNLELVFHGRVLLNDHKLKNIEYIKPNGIVHCFQKTKQYEPYTPSPSCNDPEVIAKMQDLFTLIAHIQINVTSRVTILQKILNEYPEFRRNLAAQAIIRDSVLFNTIHQTETMQKIAENYPIICEAAPFIVDTIKKELTRSTTTANMPHSEILIESPNSSEEENSLGASSSNENSASTAAQNEESRIRAITRQQLQDALANVGVGGGSSNSLSNIAQRNVDSNTQSSAAPLSSSASGERISAEMFRQHMARAFSMLGSAASSSSSSSAAAAANNDASTAATQAQPMDTADSLALSTTNDETNDTIPSSYRNHEYAEQLRTMAQMGFLNYEENLTYLGLTNGNIGNAINLLMGASNE